MKTTLLSALLVMACATTTLARDDHATWYADYDEAVAVAKEQGKDLFVDFTGSDWCHWCKLLHKEVFEFAEFLEPAQKDVVLVALDFPNGEEAKAKVPNPERNQELAETYGIQGFPTCLLMNTDGVVLARMGYQEGGPETYLADMRAALAEGKRLLVQLEELKTEYAAAEDKTPVVRKAIGMLEGMGPDSTGVSIVAGMVNEALTLDPENAAGLKLAAVKALLASAQANDAVRAEARELDPKNEQGLLELVVKAQFGVVRDDVSARAAIAAIEGLLKVGKMHDATEVKSMTAMAAMWAEGPLQDHEKALVLAGEANRIVAEIDPGLQQAIDGLLE